MVLKRAFTNFSSNLIYDLINIMINSW